MCSLWRVIVVLNTTVLKPSKVRLISSIIKIHILRLPDHVQLTRWLLLALFIQLYYSVTWTIDWWIDDLVAKNEPIEGSICALALRTVVTTPAVKSKVAGAIPCYRRNHCHGLDCPHLTICRVAACTGCCEARNFLSCSLFDLCGGFDLSTLLLMLLSVPQTVACLHSLLCWFSLLCHFHR